MLPVPPARAWRLLRPAILILLEIFAGGAALSAALLGSPVLVRPPLDLHGGPAGPTRAREVLQADLLDPAVEFDVARQIQDPFGPNMFQFSPPTHTFRLDLAGSTRSAWDPGGRGRSPAEQDGNQLAAVTGRLASMAMAHGKHFSMIGPNRSYFWSLAEIMRVAAAYDTFSVILDASEFLDEHGQGTRAQLKILTNFLALRGLARRAQPRPLAPSRGGGRPDRAHGSSKLPIRLRSSWAQILGTWTGDPVRCLCEGSSWARTVLMTVPSHKRKRPLGQEVRAVEIAHSHKRQRTVRAGIAAGRQMRRQAFEPVFTHELEPGVAAAHAIKHPFPFDTTDALSAHLQQTIQHVAQHQSTIAEERAAKVEKWTALAHELRPKSLALLRSLPKANQKVLLRGENLGEFFHVFLFEAMLREIGDPDHRYPEAMARGLNVVGHVQESGAWPKDPDVERCRARLTMDAFLAGAWEFRAKLASQFRMDEYSDTIYTNTIKERDLGFCEGPFLNQSDVTKHFVESQVRDPDNWKPMRRFGVPQKGSIRGVDDAAENDANATSSRTEKLETSSVDMIVSMIRTWITISGADCDLGAWAMDEYKAYRQIAVQPDQRRFSVVALVNPNRNPISGRPEPRLEYFVMNGHCFGFTNAVYNYNRRPRALNEILIREFLIPTDFYYDDRWGIEPMASIPSAFATVEAVTNMLGILVQDDKIQGPPELKRKDETGQTITVQNEKPWKDPELLGVLFDLDKLEVKVKPGRKQDLEHEIKAILESRSLSPGHASKLKGRLFFLTGTLFGRIGRAFMRPLSERQYEHEPFRSRGKNNNKYVINGAIEDALKSWLMILERGRPRAIRDLRPGPADVVFFSDGSAPEEGDPPGTKPKVGAVVLAWWRENPVAFEMEVPEHLIKTWIPRANQIALIELFAAVLVLSHFGPELAGKRVLGLIDSECALDALIKGQSKFSDVIKLLKQFWDLVAEYEIDLYLDRVSTDANPSDGMSRDGRAEAEAMGWDIEQVQFPQSLNKTRNEA